MMGIIRKIGLSFMAFSLAISGMGPFAQAQSVRPDKADGNPSKKKDRKPPGNDEKQAGKGKTVLEKKKREWASGSR